MTRKMWTMVRADHCHPGYHLRRRDGINIKSAVRYGKCITQRHGHFIEVMIEVKENGKEKENQEV